MNRRRGAGLLAFLVSVGVVGVYLFAPGRFDAARTEIERLSGEVPGPVLVALIGIIVVAVFVFGAIFAARLLYRLWRWVDSYVFWVYDLVLPESPVLRFGIGLIFLVLVFLIGPLVALQAMYVDDDSDDGPEDPETNGENNETDESSDTAGEDTADATGASWGAETHGSDEGDPRV